MLCLPWSPHQTMCLGCFLSCKNQLDQRQAFLWTKEGNGSFSSFCCCISLVGLQTSHLLWHIFFNLQMEKPGRLWKVFTTGGYCLICCCDHLFMPRKFCIHFCILEHHLKEFAAANVDSWLYTWNCACVVFPLVLGRHSWQQRRETGPEKGWTMFVQSSAQAIWGSSEICSAQGQHLVEAATILLLILGEGSLRLEYILYSSFEHWLLTKTACWSRLGMVWPGLVFLVKEPLFLLSGEWGWEC